MTSLVTGAARDDLESAFSTLASAVKKAVPLPAAAPSSNDPMTRLEEVFAAAATTAMASRTPFVYAVSGDVDRGAVQSLAERHFDFRFNESEPDAPVYSATKDAEITIAEPKAQAAIGFMATAPAAGLKESLATKIALYVLSHGYEGRLGKEAVSRQGLAYYIDARYRAGVSGGLVTLAAGVDPGKQGALRTVMKSEIARLSSEPPTDAEIAEAKRHLIGRKISAAQSNAEIARALIDDFIAVGAPETPAALAARLETVTRADVVKAAAGLASGAVVTIRVGGVE